MRKFQPRTKRNDYQDDISYDSKAETKSEGSVQVGLSVKSLGGMARSSYSFPADPYSGVNASSTPYNILAPFNKKVGGSYKGLQNIDGGNVQQYTNSVMSAMLAYFDFFRLKMQYAYRLRPAVRPLGVPSATGSDDAYIGSGLIDQCLQATSEGTSILNSTTFTQMAINRYAVETDMAMGVAPRSSATLSPEHPDYVANGNNERIVYTELPSVLYATMTYYQMTLQEVLNMFNWFNSFRLKMGTMIRSSWNRETPALNSLFGLFNKKSFLSLLDSIAMSMPGEYVDTDWAKQVNLLNSMPSRRSNAFTDPVLELQTRGIMPTVFKMHYLNEDGEIIATVFDASADFTKTFQGDGETSKYLFDAIDEIGDMLSAENIMQWARNNVVVAGDADNNYFNEVKFRMDVVQLCLTTFKTKFNDVREVLDTLTRPGVITWSKGFRPSITKDTDAALFDNQLVDDIYAMTFGGATDLSFDVNTKRWRSFSVWNMYSGVPEYDTYSGGVFLSMSAKKIDTSADSDQTFKYLPIMFKYDNSLIGDTRSGVVVYATSRDGVRVFMKALEVQMSAIPVFRRLVPLPSQAALKMRVPTYIAFSGTLTSAHQSALYKQMTQVFGSAAIPIGAEQYDYALDPDIVAVYQYELEDVTNESIAYARATGPFRGSIDFQDKIGFSTFGTR